MPVASWHSKWHPLTFTDEPAPETATFIELALFITKLQPTTSQFDDPEQVIPLVEDSMLVPKIRKFAPPATDTPVAINLKELLNMVTNDVAPVTVIPVLDMVLPVNGPRKTEFFIIALMLLNDILVVLPRDCTLLNNNIGVPSEPLHSIPTKNRYIAIDSKRVVPVALDAKTIPLAVEPPAPASRVILLNPKPFTEQSINAFDKVLGLIIVLSSEVPIILMPFAVIVSGPALLSSV